MKFDIFFKGVGILFIVACFSSCTKDKCKKKIIKEKAVPVYHSLKTLRKTVEVTGSKPLDNPGKIYYRTDGYLFVGEEKKGIHIFDNTNPQTPRNIGYIKIPGNTDIAVKGDVLYANSFTDLYVINVSNPSNAKITGRIDKVFSRSSMSMKDRGKFVEGKGVIVNYKTKKVTKEVECSDHSPVRKESGTPLSGGSTNTGNSGIRTSSGNTTRGIGGSMARFAVDGDYLYGVDWTHLNIFNIANPAKPDLVGEKQIQEGVETIFPYKDNLFIGSRSGMFIYDNSTPTNPVEVSRFEHVTVCDPVYPTDSFAYVTLNGGGPCGRSQERLDVLDITDIQNPELMESYRMQDPKGLAVKNEVLYLCGGKSGLKVFSTANKYKIKQNQLDHKTGIHAYDVIPYEKVLMVIGNTGLYQYDYSDPNNLKRLSQISSNNGDS